MSEIIIPEVEVLDLDGQIESALKKHNVTEAIIEGLKEKYGGLKLASLNDKDSYLNLKEARKEVRKWGIQAEKICEKGREDANEIRTKWIAKQKEILGKIAEVQDPLDAEMKKFEDEKDRIEKEEAERKESAFRKRQEEIIKMGATFIGSSYVLGDVSFESGLIRDSDEDTYTSIILPKYTLVYEKNESEKAEAARIQKEKEETLRKQQEELERQQKEFTEKQGEFNRQQEQAQREARERQLLKEKEENERSQKLITHRSAILSGLGMTFNGSEYHFQDINVHATEMSVMDESEWVALVQKITPVIAQRKQDAEEKRVADIKLQQEQAEHRAAEAERLRIEKENEQKELQRQQDEAKKAEELAQADDKTKWAAFLVQLNKLSHFDMKSPKYRKMQGIAKEKIEEIINL